MQQIFNARQFLLIHQQFVLQSLFSRRGGSHTFHIREPSETGTEGSGACLFSEQFLITMMISPLDSLFKVGRFQKNLAYD